MADQSHEDERIRSVALRNAQAIFLARQRADKELLEAKKALEQKTEELAQQREWFQVTLSSIGDAVITTDTMAKITFLNPMAELLTGWKLSEAWGRPLGEVFRILNERTRGPVSTAVDKVLAAQVTVILENETVLVARGGAEIAIEDSAAPIRDPNGAISGVVMVFRDVSERRQKSIALSKSEERFRLLGEVVPQLIWTTDAKGKRDYLNERWASFTGLPLDRWSWADIVHPQDLLKSVEAWKRAIQTGSPFESEFRIRRYDGQYCWFVSRGVPLRDEHGEIVRWYGSCTDIHQQRLTAEALREEYTITEQLHEVSKALASELDLAKVVQIITDAGTRVTRAQFGAFFYNVLDEKGGSYMLYTLSGAPRSAFDKFPMPKATAIFGPTFRGEGVIRSEDIRKDPRFGKSAPFHGMPPGHLPVVSYLAVSVTSRSGEVIGGLFFGHASPGVFTERDEKMIVGIAAQAAAAMDTAKLYQQEQQARAASEQDSQAKDHFLAALSHELRTPLTPVLAILSSLHDEGRIPQSLAEDLETVRRNVELEARLIDDLLDLTRITRGKLELHRKPVTVGRLIHDAIATCLSEISAKGLVLVQDLEQTALTLDADPTRIVQILWNLLKNSVKFTPSGGRITVRSRIDESIGGRSMLLTVEDSGMGIAPDRLSQVFEAFEQGDRRITKQFGGLGLGLAISKAIAESHEGTLSVFSAGLGCGATFTLRLPVRGGVNNSAQALEQPSQPLRSVGNFPVVKHTLPHLRILLIEDHVDTAAILIRVLKRMGHEVIHANTIGEGRRNAHAAMAANGLDLVMSDLGLPDGSGLDLMRELSAAYTLRGIALSGFGMESDVEESRAAGFSRHLIKPVDLATLKATIAEVTADR